MTDVSAIIVNWNTRELLLKCIDSLLRCTRSVSLEVIVVDNASADGSADAVRNQFPGVRLIVNDANLGFAKANNIGIRASSGRYVCLVNSDVEVHDGCLDTLCAFMDSSRTIAVAGPRVLWPDGSMQSTCRKFPGLWNNLCPALGLDRLFPRTSWLSGEHMFYFAHDRRRDVDVLVGCLMIARREAFHTIGLLDEQFFIYAEDVDWCRRFRSGGWSVAFCPDAQATHRGRSSSSSNPARFSIEQLKAVFQYWRKHHGPVKCTLFHLIVILHYALRLCGLTVLSIVRPSAREDLLRKRVNCRTAIAWLLSNGSARTGP